MSKILAKKQHEPSLINYSSLLSEISGILEQARTASVRTVNNILTMTYWEIGRRIVEFEQEARSGQATENSFLLNWLMI